MSDVSVFSSRYNTFHSTFKETSLDSENNYYLCTDESQTIIDFDKLLEDRYPDSNTRPNSFDAIYKDNGFVKEIFTSDVDFFTRAFRLKFKKELAC